MMFSRLIGTSKTPASRILPWGTARHRTMCSGLDFIPSIPDDLPSSAGTKILETFKEEFEVGSRLITLETGKIARFANGAAVLAMEETRVLSTVASTKDDCVRDFLPLTVDYQEKQFARGVIPGTYMRREGPPRERELLCGRIIDRPIRPLFPAGFYNEVQVTASVLSSDGLQDPDVLAANATSAALMLSDIPWGGPIGVVRLGRIDGRFVVNPTMEELELSDLNLIYACTKDKTLMIDAQARQISERDFDGALRMAHVEAVKCLEPQRKLAAKAGKGKREYKLYQLTEKTLEKVHCMAGSAIEAVFTDSSYGKFERGEALDKITQDVKKKLLEEGDEEILKILPKAVDKVRKEIVRKRIITEGFRVDGRRLDEVRPIYCEAGNLPILHGSSLFSRGDTQVLCTVTLGAYGDAQQLQSLVGPSTKRFMLHYSFPPFCINEVGKKGGLNRREIGHGTLAEKALHSVLQSDKSLPYTIRINSEVMASDGSTSMASVCGGSMALMDAGIPLADHVAGISIGLVSETDSVTGEIRDYRILTDILGLEDHLGDMDFKIAGTRKGITAIQLDIKPAGIPLDIICECLEPALKGRLQILDCMDQEISTPRSQANKNAPRLATLKFSNETLRRLIGPLGVLKAKIEEETGARLSISDGTLTVIARNQLIMEKAREKIDFTVGRELEVGGIYKGTITSIKEYGAFVEFNGGQLGLLHISEMSHGPVTKISDIVSVGQQLSLMCIGQDLRGNIKLSLKATSPKPEGISTGIDMSSFSSTVELTDGDEHKNSPNVSRQDEVFNTLSPAVIVRSVEECDKLEKASEQHHGKEKLCKPSPVPKKRGRPKKNTSSNEKAEHVEASSMSEVWKTGSNSRRSLKKESNQKVAPAQATTKTNAKEFQRAKNMKIGTKATAKILQVRAFGLVLDLGGIMRGMYRFEANEKGKFAVGDELRVCCESFTDKGIPVFSLLDD